MLPFRFDMAFYLMNLASHRKLWLALLLGMLVVVSTLSIYAIYPSAVESKGLENSLDKREEIQLDIKMGISAYTTSPAAYQQASRTMDDISRSLAVLSTPTFRSGTTRVFYADQPRWPGADSDGRYDSRFTYVSAFETRAKFLSGALPAIPSVPPPSSDTTLTLQVAIHKKDADRLGIKTGDSIPLRPSFGGKRTAVAVVSGIFEPADSNDKYWKVYGNDRLNFAVDNRTLPMFISESTLFNAVGTSFPEMLSDLWWYNQAEKGAINTENAAQVNLQINSASQAMFSRFRGVTFETELDNAIREYEQKLFFARIPVSVLSFLVAGIAFIYLVFVSSFLLSSLSSELALLRSRGASNLQLLSVFAFQGLVLSLFAFVVGIPLAALLVALLGLVSPFSIVSGSSLLWVGIPSSALWLGALGAFVGFVAILVPAIRASSVTSVTARSLASRPQSHFFTRFYLDVFIAIAAGLLYWQLSSSGSFVSSDLFSGRHEDKLLLAAPMLLILAGVLLFMRLFPIVVSLAVSVAKPLAGVVPVLVLRRVSRDVSSYSVMVALIGLATGLGVFVASFGGTLSRSYSDRALYNIGADARLDGVVIRSRSGPSVPFPGPLSTINGADSISSVYYGDGRIGTSGFDSNISILGVDPQTFAQTAWFRDDFSNESLNNLMKHLVTDQPANGLPLPEGSRTLSVSLKPVVVRRDLTFYARIEDANRHYFSYPLGVMDFTDWRQFTVNVTAPPPLIRPIQGPDERPSPVAPVKLTSLYAMQTSSFNVSEAPGGFHFSGLNAGLANGSNVPLNVDVKTPDWQTIAITREPTQDAFDISETVRLNGSSTGFFSWGAGFPSSIIRGVRYGPQWQPLPAIMDGEFMENKGIGLGDPLEARAFGGDVGVTPVAKATYFPATNPTRQPFMVINLWDALERINITSANSDIQPSSLWLKTDAPLAVKTSVQNVSDNPLIFSPSLKLSGDIVESFHIDPLIAAGWRGLVAIAFGAALIIGVTAYLFINIFSYQRHALDLAVLQAMGLTRRQWITSVVLEHTLYLTCGFLAGAFIGTRLASSVMPFLAITEGGDKVIPPFVIETDWLVASVLMMAVILTFCVIIALTFRRFRKLPVVETIRAGQL